MSEKKKTGANKRAKRVAIIGLQPADISPTQFQAPASHLNHGCAKIQSRNLSIRSAFLAQSRLFCQNSMPDL